MGRAPGRAGHARRSGGASPRIGNCVGKDGGWRAPLHRGRHLGSGAHQPQPAELSPGGARQPLRPTLLQLARSRICLMPTTTAATKSTAAMITNNTRCRWSPHASSARTTVRAASQRARCARTVHPVPARSARRPFGFEAAGPADPAGPVGIGVPPGLRGRRALRHRAVLALPAGGGPTANGHSPGATHCDTWSHSPTCTEYPR